MLWKGLEHILSKGSLEVQNNVGENPDYFPS